MKVSAALIVLSIAVAQARPVPVYPVDSIESRQFGDLFKDFDLGDVGGLFGLGGNSDDSGEKSTGGKILDTVKDVITNAGNDDAADNEGGGGGILKKIGGLFGLGKDKAAAPAPEPAPAPAPEAVPEPEIPEPAPAPVPEPAPAPAPAADPAPAPAPPVVEEPEDAPVPSTGSCSSSLPSINAASTSLIQEFEGFETSPEPDPIGLPTVGFGHLCKQRGCTEVTNQGLTFPLSRAEGTQLLQADLPQFTRCLSSLINENVVLNDNQFGALTSFAFNLGCDAVRKSTLLRRLNAGENPNTVAAQELPKFRRAGGKIFQGLVRRRAAEVALFQTPSNTVALPVCN